MVVAEVAEMVVARVEAMEATAETVEVGWEAEVVTVGVARAAGMEVEKEEAVEDMRAAQVEDMVAAQVMVEPWAATTAMGGSVGNRS